MAENPDLDLDLKLDLDLAESKHGHERGQYLTDFDDFSVVEELRVRAFQRHQNHQNPSGIDLVRGHVLIHPGPGSGPDFRPFFPGPCNQDLEYYASSLKSKYAFRLSIE